MLSDWILPDWPAPSNVLATSTTRHGGVSTGACASLNLGTHVGDDPDAVKENRRRARDALQLVREPCWLRQVHGTCVARPDDEAHIEPADAALTRHSGRACVILTADCLPVLLCDRAGTTVAAVHCGWRSLSAGVLENTVHAMQIPGMQIMAWLGPAIGPGAYEVGDEVMQAFVDHDVDATTAFQHQPNGKWLCDLYALARMRLEALGVKEIYGGGFCTLSDRERFFSYRRDGECGRMGTFIWLAP
ncbi:MAG TPA: peptidoglycan editing factor PgeF [Gammaproteobacteria bacterium]|nr:peptidoglycan editing factor PgeF [Gammaproteobacteria bacterium]